MITITIIRGIKMIVKGYKIEPKADLLGANLRYADLTGCRLTGCRLRDADLQGADLQGADLQGADLQGADLDFSCFTLSCNTFNIKDDGRLFKQLLSHLARFNRETLPKDIIEFIKNIPDEYKNDICKRHNIKRVD